MDMSKKIDGDHVDSQLNTDNNLIPSGLTAYLDNIKSGINQIGLHIILDEGVKLPEEWSDLINSLINKKYTPITENPKLFGLFKLLTENASGINYDRSTHASYYLRSEAVRVEFRRKKRNSNSDIDPDIDEENTEEIVSKILFELEKLDHDRKKAIFIIFWKKIKAQIKNDQASNDILMYLARNLQLDEEPRRLLNKLHKKPSQVVVKAVEFDQRFTRSQDTLDHEKDQLNDKEIDIVNSMQKLLNIKKLNVTVIHEQHNHVANSNNQQSQSSIDGNMERILGILSKVVTPLLTSVFTVILVKNERYFLEFLSSNYNSTGTTKKPDNDISTSKSLEDANKRYVTSSELKKRSSPSLSQKVVEPEGTILCVDLDEALTAFDISFILYFTNKMLLEKLEERKRGDASVSWIKGFDLSHDEQDDYLIEIHYFLSSKYNYEELKSIQHVRSISECFTCVKLFRNDQKFLDTSKMCSLKSARLLERIPILLPCIEFKSSEKLIFSRRCIGDKYLYNSPNFFEEYPEFFSHTDVWQSFTFRFISFNFSYKIETIHILKFIELIKKLETKLFEPNEGYFNYSYPPIVTRICIQLSHNYDLLEQLKVNYPDILLESDPYENLNNKVIIDIPAVDLTKMLNSESLIFNVNEERYCFLLTNKETVRGDVTFNDIEVSYELALTNQPSNQGECHIL